MGHQSLSNGFPVWRPSSSRSSANDLAGGGVQTIYPPDGSPSACQQEVMLLPSQLQEGKRIHLLFFLVMRKH